MRPYRSEALFSAALRRMLKPHCRFMQRIESGQLGRGIPDIYCRFPNNELWIETKNTPKQSIHSKYYHIPWRPGQQAWHYEYYLVSNRPVLTITACLDGFLVYALREAGEVPTHENVYACTELRDLWTIIKGFI
jgi:hypothetical protein